MSDFYYAYRSHCRARWHHGVLPLLTGLDVVSYSRARKIAMLRMLLRCSVAAVASIALTAAFVTAPEGFTQARKPARSGRGTSQKSYRGSDRLKYRQKTSNAQRGSFQFFRIRRRLMSAIGTWRTKANFGPRRRVR
jgi:hypothetical protein